MIYNAGTRACRSVECSDRIQAFGEDQTYHVVEQGLGRRLEHRASPLDVDEGVNKHLNSVLISSHHQIREADVVASSDDARWNASDEQLKSGEREIRDG